MLTHPLYEKLAQLRLSGMLLGLKEQMNCPEVDRLSFEERLGLLVDRQITERENHQLAARLKKARLRQNACGGCRLPSPSGTGSGAVSAAGPVRLDQRVITMCSSSVPPVWARPILHARWPTRPVFEMTGYRLPAKNLPGQVSPE